jgi:uncharacterized protein (TIGR02597 family)
MLTPIRYTRTLLAAIAALGLASISSAQTVATKPVGAVSLTIKGASDTIVAVPLQEAASYTGTIASKALTTGVWSISPNGVPSWASNAFQGFYYVRMTSGAKAGMYYAIASNDSSNLVLSTAGDDLTSIAAGDSFSVYKFWTLGTLFPHNDPSKNPLTVSGGTLANVRRSQIIIPDNTFAGINLPAQGTYFFTSTGWKKSVSGNPDATNTILFPDEYIIVRQPAVVASDVSVTFVGSVNTDPLALALATRAAGTQDNAVALLRPADVTLADSGLASGFVSSTGTLANARRDQLFVFDNAATGINKSAAKIYYRFNGNWIRATTGNPIANTDVLTVGSGFIIRKYQNASSTVDVAINNPNY